MSDASDTSAAAFETWERRLHAFAALADPAAARGGAGSLGGLRVGVKDIIDVAGLPTRNGSAACADASPAAQDAPAVAALRAAGAAILGKTVTTEFAFTDPTDRRARSAAGAAGAARQVMGIAAVG
ncbi:MAG: amidase family protein, partial [Pseudomonadota bacterium]